MLADCIPKRNPAICTHVYIDLIMTSATRFLWNNKGSLDYSTFHGIYLGLKIINAGSYDALNKGFVYFLLTITLLDINTIRSALTACLVLKIDNIQNINITLGKRTAWPSFSLHLFSVQYRLHRTISPIWQAFQGRHRVATFDSYVKCFKFLIKTFMYSPMTHNFVSMRYIHVPVNRHRCAGLWVISTFSF